LSSFTKYRAHKKGLQPPAPPPGMQPYVISPTGWEQIALKQMSLCMWERSRENDVEVVRAEETVTKAQPVWHRVLSAGLKGARNCKYGNCPLLLSSCCLEGNRTGFLWKQTGWHMRHCWLNFSSQQTAHRVLSFG